MVKIDYKFSSDYTFPTLSTYLVLHGLNGTVTILSCMSSNRNKISMNIKIPYG